MSRSRTRSEVARPAFEVFLDAAELGPLQKVGVLYRQAERTDLPSSFEYDRGWLESEHAFLLDPRLSLWVGEQYPADRAPAFGVFMDSAPDRWGRVLMDRREANLARCEQRRPRVLQELDFLLGVQDVTRMGGLRFRDAGRGAYLDDSERAIPPVTSLRELAAISRRIEEPGVEELPEYPRWLAMLITPGSSLGGARPKANFTETDGQLWIAKFPAHGDRYDVGAWEHLVHRLAERAGVRVPASRSEALTDRYHTFCVRRFDRTEGMASRRMFSSAMTLLEHQDGDDGGSYLDLCEFLANHGAEHVIDVDLAQLFRRVVFNVLVGNRDDHLRNHGFLREPTGWRLAPAYDMNPNPHKADHALLLDDSVAAPDVDVVVATAELYRLDRQATSRIVDEVSTVVATWKDLARGSGLPRSEIELMETVFQA